MRLAWVPLVAVLCGIGGAGFAMAQEPPSSPPRDLAEPTAAVEAKRSAFQSLKEFGSFGASLGLMSFIADEDASKDALVRPTLSTVFRYKFSEKWVGVGEFGFGWNAYKDRADTVMSVYSMAIGAFRHVGRPLGLDLRVGGGGGFYRWQYKDTATIAEPVRDPQTELEYKGFDPGLFAGLEAEHRLSTHVTLLGQTQLNYLFSKNEEDFPTQFGSNDAFFQIRLGVNYHFSPYEGILWERKTKRTIKLTSGKAGS
jgi:hypothetical protein